MPIASDGRPGKQNSSVAVVKRSASHRKAAIVNQAFDEMERERGAGKRDYVARLIDAYHADPLTWLERVREIAEGPQQPDGGKVQPALSMQAFFLQAARNLSESMRAERD